MNNFDKNLKICITGASSSGKTRLVDMITQRQSDIFCLLGLNSTTYPEAARVIINQRLANGETIEDIFKDNENLQRTVFFQNQRNFELSLQSGYQISFFDSGMVDEIAYHIVYGGRIHSENIDYIKKNRYDAVFFLEHPLIFEEDGVRIGGVDDALKIQKELLKIYPELGYKPIMIPAFRVGKQLENSELEKILYTKFLVVTEYIKSLEKK